MKILVCGAGVVGLTTAVELQARGHRVELLSAEEPADTTSARAGAIWYPQKAEPFASVRKWSAETLDVFRTFATDPASGIALRRGRKIFHRPVGIPWWEPLVPEFRALAASELPAGGKSGYEFEIPVVDMTIYLSGYLKNRFLAAGGIFRIRKIKSPALASFGRKLVVNCTGLGARELFSDADLFPIRGQALRIRSPVSNFLLDNDHPEGPVQIIPRTHDCYLGVTSDKGNESKTVDPAETRKILDRCGKTGAVVLAASKRGC